MAETILTDTKTSGKLGRWAVATVMQKKSPEASGNDWEIQHFIGISFSTSKEDAEARQQKLAKEKYPKHKIVICTSMLIGEAPNTGILSLPNGDFGLINLSESNLRHS